jgi:hypothetical protein
MFVVISQAFAEGTITCSIRSTIAARSELVNSNPTRSAGRHAQHPSPTTPPKLADINGNNDRGLRDWRSMTHRHNDTSGVLPEEPKRGNARILKEEYLTIPS